MLVRSKKQAPQHKAAGGQPTAKPQAVPYTFPAPIGGLSLDRNLSIPAPGTARVLDNWTCTTTGIKVRGGTSLHATIEGACTSLFTYKAGSSEKLFATSAAAIYDVTAPADPLIPPTASVSGQTSGNYAVAQFAASGGNYLYAVNGADSALLYDGTAWTAITGASVPAITGVATTALSQVWNYASRLFFVQGGTFNAWYLPVDSIAGAATSFSLAGVFRKGGALLFGATWSSDSGAGLDDRCVFVSTEGEAAVYQGTDPGSNFQLVGVYDLPRPIGKNSHIQAGGDLLIATNVGLVSISSAVQADVAALPGQAFSRAIAPLWQRQAVQIAAQDWQMIKVPNENIMLVSQPTQQLLLVAHLQTGAWSTWSGTDARGIALFDDNAYCGNGVGRVFLMNAGGSDNGTPYTARYLGSFDPAGSPGMTKSVRQARATFQAAGAFVPSITFKADFDEAASPIPASPPNYSLDVWDLGQWDVAVWDAAQPAQSSVTGWGAMAATGSYIAPEVQLTFGITPSPRVELVSIDAMIDMGAVVT